MNSTNITDSGMGPYSGYSNATMDNLTTFNETDPDIFGLDECRNCNLVKPAQILLIVCVVGMCLQLLMIYAAFCLKEKYRRWIADIPSCCRTPRLVRDIEMQRIA